MTQISLKCEKAYFRLCNRYTFPQIDAVEGHLSRIWVCSLRVTLLLLSHVNRLFRHCVSQSWHQSSRPEESLLERQGMLQPDNLRNSSFTEPPTFLCDLPNLRRSKEFLAEAESCIEVKGATQGHFLAVFSILATPEPWVYRVFCTIAADLTTQEIVKFLITLD